MQIDFQKKAREKICVYEALRLTQVHRDLLRRHYMSIHAPPTELESTQPDDELTSMRNLTTERISIACANCAASKTKCDNQMPCERCVKKKLTCERRAVRRSGGKNTPEQLKRTGNSIKPSEEEPSADNSDHTDHGMMKDQASGESSTSPVSSDYSVEVGANEQPGHTFEFAPVLKSTEVIAFNESTCSNSGPLVLPSTADINYPTLSDSVAHSMLQDIDLDTPMEEFPSSGLFAATNPDLLSNFGANFHDSLWAFETGGTASIPLSFSALPLPTVVNPSPVVPDFCSQWPIFHCNPQPEGENFISASMSTASLLNLRVLNNPSVWSSVSLCHEIKQSANSVKTACSSEIQPMEAFSRDKLLAITQKLWNLAKESTALPWWQPDQMNDEANPWMDHIVLLPPVEVSQQFCKEYILKEYQRFHMLPPAQGLASPSPILETENTILAGINVLLAIAQSTRSSPAGEIRALSNGLAEVCRIVMQNEEFAITPEFLNASLSVLQLIQWSGDAWHMSVRYIIRDVI